MVYLETTSDEGRAIYFDAHAAERCAQGVRVCGTIGDGCYEGEVLVEVGRVMDVTFADAWLGGGGYRTFISHCDPENLKQALLETVGRMTAQPVRHDTAHPQVVSRATFRVAEDGPFWKVVA